jgi:hypothetical protein
MVWKPIKGQEALAGLPSELARRMLPAGRLPDDRVLGPAASQQLHAEGFSPLAAAASGMAVGLPGSGIAAGVPVGLGVRLEAIEERLGQQELRVDRLEEAIARMKIRSEAPVNEVAGETSFPGVSPEERAEEISAADRQARYREANREKLRVQAQARRAKKRAEAGR